METLNITERVELLKSVRSSGVILEAGLRGIVVGAAGADVSKIQFEDDAATYSIVNRYLARRAA